VAANGAAGTSDEAASTLPSASRVAAIAADLSDEITALWKRMCKPRQVTKEFARLRTNAKFARKSSLAGRVLAPRFNNGSLKRWE
jgi:hypothetical protein